MRLKRLSGLLDIHAPVKRRTIILRPHAPWYNDSINDEKKKRRRLERRWRATRLSIDRELYVNQCALVNQVISEAKSNYYSAIIAENKSNQRVLFNTVDRLLHRKTEKHYPTVTSKDQLVNNFAVFFSEKISKMRCALSVNSDLVVNPLPDVSRCQTEFSEFRCMNSDDVSKILVSASLKTCDLDPLPSTLMKGCLDILLPVVTRIVNMSLETATMPENFKEAMVIPNIKKDSLDHELYPHFRPISNLKLVSKVIEKGVACQLIDYLRTNGLEESLQSAYKTFHSTETALVKVQNDILCAIDQQQSVILLLLDLSAAFD